MGCVNTKKQTKDEDKKEEEASPDKNGAVENSAPAKDDGAKQDEVQISVTAEVPSSGDPDLDEFRRQALDVHNRQRDIHGVPALTLNPELNDSAQRWAENIAKLNMLKHTAAADRKLNGEMFGENLAHKNFGSSDKSAVDKFDPSGEEIVMMWYDECKDPGYDYSKDSQSGTGHFTQVVWKATTSMGIGKVRIQDGNMVNVFVCGQYLPAGNFVGEFTENVMPPKS